MASTSVPCPKASAVPPSATLSPRRCVGFSQIPSMAKGSNQRRFPTLKAQLPEVATGKPTSSPVPSTTSKIEPSNGETEEESAAVSESVISAFMAEVADLVKLVDSRDITELQLKQKDCELIIRKKEALPQPTPSAPAVTMQNSQQAMYGALPPMPSAPPPPLITAAASSAASAPALPSSKGINSSHHSLKCPMAGTFYRCPGPGEPPFVKVGDKVKKGQVVCIIEAMKLMNEIEADQDGTVVEIIAEDGKPVSVDTPLLVIEP